MNQNYNQIILCFLIFCVISSYSWFNHRARRIYYDGKGKIITPDPEDLVTESGVRTRTAFSDIKNFVRVGKCLIQCIIEVGKSNQKDITSILLCYWMCVSDKEPPKVEIPPEEKPPENAATSSPGNSLSTTPAAATGMRRSMPVSDKDELTPDIIVLFMACATKCNQEFMPDRAHTLMQFITCLFQRPLFSSKSDQLFRVSPKF